MLYSKPIKQAFQVSVSLSRSTSIQVFGAVFAHFNWTDITLIMDRDHEHSLILGETLDVGLQIGGYKPNVVKYYSKSNPDYEDILRDASQVSRGM